MSGGGGGGEDKTATVTATTAAAAMANSMATATTTAAVATTTMMTETTTVVTAGVDNNNHLKAAAEEMAQNQKVVGTATAGQVQFAHVRAVGEVRGNERHQLLGRGLASDVELHERGFVILESGQSELQDSVNLLVGVLVLLRPILALVIVVVVVVVVVNVVNVVIIDGGGVIVA